LGGPQPFKQGDGLLAYTIAAEGPGRAPSWGAGASSVAKTESPRWNRSLFCPSSSVRNVSATPVPPRARAHSSDLTSAFWG